MDSMLTFTTVSSKILNLHKLPSLFREGSFFYAFITSQTSFITKIKLCFSSFAKMETSKGEY